MLDCDLAELYGVRATALRQQVKRNKARFPSDFMFQLTRKEANILVSQNVIPTRRSLNVSLPYFHARGRGNALVRSSERSHGPSEHRNHASLRRSKAPR